LKYDLFRFWSVIAPNQNEIRQNGCRFLSYPFEIYCVVNFLTVITFLTLVKIKNVAKRQISKRWGKNMQTVSLNLILVRNNDQKSKNVIF